MDDVQHLLDRYLKGEAELEETALHLHELSRTTSGLALDLANLSDAQCARMQALLRRFREYRRREAEHLLSEARRSGKTIAELHVRPKKPRK